MRPDFGQAAATLLVGGTTDESSTQIAERAANACEQLAKHLSRLLGETGVHLLLKRSIMIARLRFPWLQAVDAGNVVSAMRSDMERQDPESITSAFVAILATFVGLLERLIGAGLVDRLLDEVWPSVFPHAAKESP